MRAAAAALLVLVLTLPATGAPQRRAVLALQSVDPLAVTGRHFGARETIVLRVLAGGRDPRTTTVRSRRNGSFRAAFPLRLDACAAFTVRAFGVRGSRAVLAVEPACKDDRDPPKRGRRRS